MIGISEIKMQLEVAEKEIASLQGGRKASAARARKSLQIIKGLAHTLRKNIVEFSRSLPTKKRAGVEAGPIAPIEPIEPIAPIAPKRKRATKKEITTI